MNYIWIIKFNNDLRSFSLSEARKAGTSTSEVPSATTAAAEAGTGTVGTAGTGIGAFPLGANLTAGGIPMPGTLQQQALSRVDLTDYRKA